MIAETSQGGSSGEDTNSKLRFLEMKFNSSIDFAGSTLDVAIIREGAAYCLRVESDRFMLNDLLEQFNSFSKDALSAVGGEIGVKDFLLEWKFRDGYYFK